jgi:hypothetical protein
VPPPVGRETQADKAATERGEQARLTIARKLSWLRQELADCLGLARARREEGLRLLASEGDIPSWLSGAIRRALAEAKVVSIALARVRCHAWEAYGDAFLDESLA